MLRFAKNHEIIEIYDFVWYKAAGRSEIIEKAAGQWWIRVIALILYTVEVPVKFSMPT